MKKPKRRRDPMPLAELVIDMATGEVPNDSPKGPENQITKARRAAGINDMSCALQAPRLRKLVLGMLVIFLYCLVIVATQESNAAAFKTVYDLSMINRIASRIETVVEDLYQTKHALVVVGRYPTFARCRYVRNPNSGNQAHVRTAASLVPGLAL